MTRMQAKAAYARVKLEVDTHHWSYGACSDAGQMCSIMPKETCLSRSAWVTELHSLISELKSTVAALQDFHSNIYLRCETSTVDVLSQELLQA